MDHLPPLETTTPPRAKEELPFFLFPLLLYSLSTKKHKKYKNPSIWHQHHDLISRIFVTYRLQTTDYSTTLLLPITTAPADLQLVYASSYQYVRSTSTSTTTTLPPNPPIAPDYDPLSASVAAITHRVPPDPSGELVTVPARAP